MALPSIADLRHRVVIESLSNSTDSQGGQVTTWSTYATVWAKLEPVSSKERMFAMNIQYQRSHKAFIRRRSDLTFTTSMRLTFDSRTFQIKGIREIDERNEWLALDLEENQGT